MSGMLSNLCAHYYRLKMKYQKRDDRLLQLIENPLKFDSQRKMNELDEILNENRAIAEASEKLIVTLEKIKETERHIVQLFKRLGVRPRWFMTGEIPGELMYEVWYDDNDNVYITKVKDIEPEPVKPNIINIYFASGEDELADEDEFDREEREEREKKREEERKKQKEAYNKWIDSIVKNPGKSHDETEMD